MLEHVSEKTLKKRRTSYLVILLVTVLIVIGFYSLAKQPAQQSENNLDVLSSVNDTLTELAIDALDSLEVKGRAAKTGYSRGEFSNGWAKVGDCDLRNIILKRDLTDIKFSSDNCIVLSGLLNDPYTAQTINFVRGSTTSDDVQIDHVVALSDAWQKGAQQKSEEERLKFANDPLNLLAVDGPANQQKGNSDAASWLPPNKSYRCRYVARQIAVKKKYTLWITEAEKATMQRILNGCKDQPLPVESFNNEA